MVNSMELNGDKQSPYELMNSYEGTLNPLTTMILKKQKYYYFIRYTTGYDSIHLLFTRIMNRIFNYIKNKFSGTT